MSDGQQLLLTFEARFERYMRNFERAQQQTDRRFRMMEQRSQRASRNMQASMARAAQGINREFSTIGRTLTVALGGALSARGAQQLLDTSTRIRNSLKVAGLEGERLTSTYDALFASAQRNSAPLESLVTLYGRVAIVQKELNVSNEELLSFSNNVALALRVAGTDAQSASGALLQLSQAMGAGIVRAEEFNSILEGALPIAQAAAAGLKEAGGSVAALRQLVVDGKLSSEAFFRAFEAGSVILEEKVAGAESTVSQAFVRLQNVLIDVAGKMDEGTGASERLVGVLQALTDWIATADFSPVINGIFDIGNAAIEVIGHVQTLARALGDLTGASQFGEWWRDRRNAQTIVRDVHAATTGSGSGDPASDAAIATALRSRGASVGGDVVQLEEVVVGGGVKAVSIADYPIGGAAGSGKGKRGGSGGRDRAAAQAEREAEAVRELISELEREKSLITATDTQRRISDALKRAGAAATAEQKARIEELITAIEREKEALEGAKAAQEELQDVARDVFSTIADGIRQGASAGEIFTAVLDRIMERLVNMAIESLVLGMFGGATGGAGIFGKLLGFSDGGYTGRGGKYEPKGIVHGGEFVMSKAATERLGVDNLEALHHSALRGFSDGGYVGGSPAVRSASIPASASAAPVTTFQISAPITVEGSAGTPDQNADLAARMGKQLEATMRGVVADEIRKQSRAGNYLNRRG